MTRTYAIITAIAIALVSVGLYSVYLLHEGGKAAQASQATAQVKQDQKVKKQYDKIDRETPYGGSDDNVAMFLMQHTIDHK